MKISKWVLFDVHDTLVSSSVYMGLYAPIVTKLVSEKGVSFTRLNKELNHIKKLGGTSRADTYDVCENFDALDLYYKELAKQIQVMPVRPDILKLFDSLREMGKRIGIVSNDHSRTVRMILEHHGLLDFVDFIFCNEHGGKKEGLAFWKKLSDDHSIEPETALVVDNDKAALDNATIVGFKTLLATSLVDYNILGKIS